MVRTKKQVLATKHKQDELKADPTANDSRQSNDKHSQAQFYAPDTPLCPLPSLITEEQKTAPSYPPPTQTYHHYGSPTMPSTTLVESNAQYFEPPYVMNNFWPPPIPIPSNKGNGKKLEVMFSNLNAQEIHEMMMDCQHNEDEAILRLITQTDYLDYIRHRIYINNNKNFPPTPRNNYISLPPIQQILKENNCGPIHHLQHQQASRPPITYNVAPPVPQQQFQQKLPKPLLLPSIPQNACIPHQLIAPNQAAASFNSQLWIRLPPPPQSKGLSPTGETLSDPANKKDIKTSVPTALLKPSTPLTTNNNNATNNKIPQQHKTHKKHNRSSSITTSNNGAGGARLTLDDALLQIQDSKEGYVGWSAARLRAYKMIDKNPNSYYYRFNAPGEQQKKGKWTDEENAMFLNRLKQVGANAQWGIFSIAIPGRVGYQCSNYYRFMIETGQLQDPNYVLDEKGKARYLFDKKTEDGAVEKIFRKHSKHGSISANDLNRRATIGTATGVANKRKHHRQEEDSDDDDPTFDIKKKNFNSKKKTTKQYQALSYTANGGGGRMTRQRLQQQQHNMVVGGNNSSDKQKDQSDHVVPN